MGSKTVTSLMSIAVVFEGVFYLRIFHLVILRNDLIDYLADVVFHSTEGRSYLYDGVDRVIFNGFCFSLCRSVDVVLVIIFTHVVIRSILVIICREEENR